MGPELSSLLTVSNIESADSCGGALGLDLASLAFWAASTPSWRICAAIVLSVDAEVGVDEVGCWEGVEVGVEEPWDSRLDLRGEPAEGVLMEAVGGGFEGVLVVEDGWVVVANERLALISPYSFHSSTSGRS